MPPGLMWAQPSGSRGLASVSDKIRDMGTVRGRVGYAFDSVLIYGTAGYAWADNRITATALGVSISDSHVHSGWTVWRRCRSDVRTEMVGQGRVPLSQLRKPELLRWRCSPCGLASGTLNLNSVQVGVNYHF